MNYRGKHTTNQKEHARTRAQERLGFLPTPKEMKDLAKRVRTGQFIRAGVKGREVWRTEFRGKPCLVVFDPERLHVVSFLRDEA